MKKIPRTRSRQPSRTVSIIGTGSYVPERILTNADLEKIVETSDEWITTRTGIKERRIAAEGEHTSHMAARAAENAMEQAGVYASEIDLIIVATVTPDTFFPSTACHVQRLLGAEKAACFDVSAACSGFLYGIEVAQQFISNHTYNTILVIGADKLSSIVNWTDRNTCVLFGDGAGAADPSVARRFARSHHHLHGERRKLRGNPAHARRRMRDPGDQGEHRPALEHAAHERARDLQAGRHVDAGRRQQGAPSKAAFPSRTSPASFPIKPTCASSRRWQAVWECRFRNFR